MRPRSFFGLRWALLVTGWVAGCASTAPKLLTLPDLPRIEITDGLEEILPGTGILDTPVLSNDGQRLTVQTQVYEDPVLPYEVYSLAVAQRDDAGAWQPARIIRKGNYRAYLGRMSMPIQPAFDETGDELVFTHIEFDSLLSIPLAGSLRSWLATIPFAGGNPESIVEYPDFDLEPTELIQHARISPDGRWLTFYTRVHEHTQGVYLLNRHTGAKYRLSPHHDKHPTWSPDGKRIYFHTVVGGARHRFDFFAVGQEIAVLGYYDMTFEGDKLIDWQRKLFDPIDTDTYIYHKHPAEVPGTGLLFFHGEEEPDGKKRIMVRRAECGSPVYVLDLYWQGKKLKKAKHPCASFTTRDMIFIAKPKGSKTYHLLMNLKDDALTRIERLVNALPATSKAADATHPPG